MPEPSPPRSCCAISSRIARRRASKKVAVLGGGLAGACVAMELASAGVRVDLFDQSATLLAKASSQNEGKIHLGYVYANDPTLRTARAMAKGAVAFGPLMRRWLGDAVDRIPVSSPFAYVVHDQSLCSVDEIDHHLRATHAIALEESGAATGDYFGSDYRIAPRRLPENECDAIFDRRSVKAAFSTGEIAIDPEAMAEVVRTRLTADANIRCLTGARVLEVDTHVGEPGVRFEAAGAVGFERYDHVVNALGDGRLAIDRTAGLEPPRPWLYRVRHFLRMRAPASLAALPSATIVLGAFGDLVRYAAGDLYCSWYPAGMQGMSSDVAPPDWPLVLGGAAGDATRAAILDGLTAVVPAVAHLASDAVACDVKGGVIFAWGETDIDDRASGLHERHTIGPISHGRYHTIVTGKLTTAPLFGKSVADRILQP